jgi:hypothetical protein
MGGRDWAQEFAARTNTLKTRNPIVVERFNFAMDFLLSELKQTQRPSEGGRCAHPERLILVEHNHSQRAG